MKQLACFLILFCSAGTFLWGQSSQNKPLGSREALLPAHPVVEEALRQSVTVIPVAPQPAQPASRSRAGGSALMRQKRPASPLPARTAVLPACVDSSYRMLFASDNREGYIYTTLKTRDGGVVVGGSGRDTLEGRPYKYYAHLVKFDGEGRFLWAKEYRGNISFEMDIQVIYEMSDGTLVVAGDYNNQLFYQPSHNYYDAMVLRLSAEGGLLWSKTFHSTQSTCMNSTSVYIQSIAEGRNGELLLGGTVINCPYPLYELAMKLDASGKLQWSRSFLHTFDGNGFGIFYHNNEAVLVGKSGGYFSGSDGTVNIHFLRMDYATGDTLGQKRWRLDGPYWGPSNFVFITGMQTRQLLNGHFAVYGKLFGDYNYNKDTTNHFGVAEFDAAFNFVSAYTINSTIKTNMYNDYLHVDEYGRVLFTAFRYTGSYSGDVFFGSIGSNGQFLNQRRKTYTGVGMPGQGGFVSYADGSYTYLQTHYSQAQGRFYFEYTRLHNSDTASDCLGVDTAFAHLVRVNYIPVGWPGLESVVDTTIYETPHTIWEKDLVFAGVDGCPQTSFCDTLKLRSLDTVCTARQEVFLSAFKNRECGTWVNWRLSDPAAADVLRQENDSTVRIRFKDGDWQGYLVGELGGKCGALKDSVPITLWRSPGAVSLGKDTSLCPGNTMELRVPAGYVSYEWQDGSADPVLVVTAPGTYHVAARDACGQYFRDTINVRAAPPVPLSVGADRVKCNNDTLHVSAPAGFLTYSWSPAYNISDIHAASVVVNPQKDTAYYLRAEKTPGCFAFDTVAVTVHHAVPIDLGSDTSFCQGDSVVLLAGPGFERYLWSGGQAEATVVARQAGRYSVQAWDTHGCRAADTLVVVEVFANPVVRLPQDSLLCSGEGRLLDAGGGYRSYAWSNGSAASSIVATGTGKYAVRVVDANGCGGGDSTAITRLLPLPAAFLPADTSVCSYGRLQLQPAKTFPAYSWSTGAATPAVTISQPGTYWLEVRDDQGCKGRDSVVVNLRQCLEGLYVPSAFTPNRDGRNDTFRALIFGAVQQYRFAVYNKWGEKVFETTDPQKGWDGTIRSALSDTHVFVWTCRYQLAGGEVRWEKGTVTLIR